MDAKNWNTTRPLLNPPLPPANFSLPFNTSMGLNAERKKAGYMPASKPTANGNAINNGNITGEKRLASTMFLPATLLNNGNTSHAIVIAIAIESNAIRIDSSRNCIISPLRSVPSTFLMPTSFARFAERAVVRFIKFIHAITSINNATAENIYTYCILPGGINSFCKPE